MALDFVSPENVQECIRLTDEFRLLPKNHRAKEDKLEVPLFLFKSLSLHHLHLFSVYLGYIKLQTINGCYDAF